MSEHDTSERAQRIIDRTRQLILMRETGPKSRAWHAARVRMIWRLHDELRRASQPAAAGVEDAARRDEMSDP
ncbi:MAG: hypothetical protein RLZZ387_4938 [Chloroflexota bacterium]|jgi:hypothetical protein